MVYRAITITRGVLVRLVYNETLGLSTTAANENPNASATLIQADVERIGFGMRNMHEAYASMLEIAVAIFLLERQLGIAVLAPLGIIIGEFSPALQSFTELLLSPLTSPGCLVGAFFTASIAGRRQKSWLEAIQTRVSVTATLLGGMRSVKSTGFAGAISAAIESLRNIEIRTSTKYRQVLVMTVILCKRIYTRNLALAPC